MATFAFYIACIALSVANGVSWWPVVVFGLIAEIVIPVVSSLLRHPD